MCISEERIFNATTSRNALWVQCDTDKEKQIFVDWIVSRRPATNVHFTATSRPGAAYAYFMDADWGPDGVIDCLVQPQDNQEGYELVDFANWLDAVMPNDDDDAVECDLSKIL